MTLLDRNCVKIKMVLQKSNDATQRAICDLPGWATCSIVIDRWFVLFFERLVVLDSINMLECFIILWEIYMALVTPMVLYVRSLVSVCKVHVLCIPRHSYSRLLACVPLHTLMLCDLHDVRGGEVECIVTHNLCRHRTKNGAGIVLLQLK